MSLLCALTPSMALDGDVAALGHAPSRSKRGPRAPSDAVNAHQRDNCTVGAVRSGYCAPREH